MTERAEKTDAPGEKPMRCSLGPGELGARQRQLAGLGAALLGAEGEEGRHRLRFADDPGVLASLDAIVKAERECCPFLDLSVDRVAGELTLGVAAQAGAEAFADAHAATIRDAATA
jgi:hypothetical protein